jgi:hypothetical protein
MSDLNEDVDSEITEDPWRRRATTTARYDLCSKCKYFAPQDPYKPGVRCIFGLRPDVIFEDESAIAKCDVYKQKTTS